MTFKLAAPPDDGTAIVFPFGDDARTALRANLSDFSKLDGRSFGGFPFPEVRRMARRELWECIQSQADTATTGEERATRLESTIVMTGHQPEFFHPGVWFKNFLVHALAQATQSTAVHLIADNDLCRATEVTAPGGSLDAPMLARVPFDDWAPAVPLEVRPLVHAGTWSSFAERVLETVSPFVDAPLIQSIWPDAVTAVQSDPHIARALSIARHRLERRWGLATGEVSAGRICDGNAFLLFLAEMMVDLPRQHEVFQAELWTYRRQYRIRSQTHPMPALRQRGDWYETPFWGWRADRPDRYPIWLQSLPGQYTLYVGPDAPPQVHSRTQHVMTVDRIADLVAALHALRQEGLKIRPRAITLTMFARLFLSDLFIHGLGGGRYDELTDRLIQSLFGIPPPRFVIATATFRLPASRRASIGNTSAAAQGGPSATIRDLRFHPERYLASVPERWRPEAAKWAEAKRVLLQNVPPRAHKKQWHERLDEANQELYGYLGDMEKQLRRGIMLEKRAEREFAVLNSREYPYILFNEQEICPRLLDLARNFA